MAPQAKLTPLQETEARRIAEQEARANKVPKTYSDEEKAARKERKERKERKRMDRELSKDRRVVPAGELLLDEGQQLVRNKLHPVGGDLVQQVSAKLLQQLGEEEQLQQQQELTPLPPSSLFPSSMEPKHKLRQQASSREPIEEG